MKKTLYILFVCLGVSILNAQNNAAEANLLTNALDSIYSQSNICGFSVAIVNEDGIAYTKGFGYADVQHKKEYTAHTIQNIGSVSKTFIGISLLKAEELGKLKLDDPIDQYLPFEVKHPLYPKEKITIRHLATHTSGIRDTSLYEKYGYVLQEKNDTDAFIPKGFRPHTEKMSLGELMEKILSKNGDWYKKKNFTKYKPGVRYEYTNFGSGLAAFVLENATGMPYRDFVKTHILEPLEMKDTSLSFDDIDFSKHSKLYNNPKQAIAFYTLANYPDGGVITSSTSLGKYLSEFIRGYKGKGTILNQESFKSFFTPVLSASHYKERSKGAYSDEYNTSIFLGFSAKGYIGHTGYDPGALCLFFFNPKTSIGKLFITNTEPDKKSIGQYKAIWKKLEEFENKF